MLKIITAILLTSFTLLYVNNCSQVDKKISLRFKYLPGMRLSYEQKSKHSTRVFEADSLIKNETSTYNVFIIQEVKRFINDSTVEIFEQDIWQYTEPNKEDSTLLDTVEYIQELNLHMLPNGKIVNIEFVDEKDITRITYIKNYYEQGMPVFPSGEKSTGYSWTQTTKVVLPEEAMEASSNYTIKSVVREAGYDCAVIKYEGNLLIPIEPNPDDSTQRRGIDRIKSEGMLYFAYKEGIIIKQRERWIVDGDRKKLTDGKMVEYKVATEYDVEYILTKREGI